MFTYKTKIFLKATDATGGLYFSALFDLAMEAFECFLSEKNLSIQKMLSSSHMMPVVHASGDFLHPLQVGDVVTLEVFCRRKTTSFVVETLFYCGGKKVASTEVVHVVVDKKTGKPTADFLELAFPTDPACAS